MTKSGMRLILSLLIVTCVVFNALPIMATAPPLRVQMYNANRAAQINSIFPWFKITNTGSAPVNLAEVKIRYYYTIDGEQPQNFWCEWSDIGAGKITGSFVKLETPFDGADYYFELGFKTGAGSLQPGQSVEVHSRFAKNDWSNYDQTNDYSFNPTAKTYVDWDKITVHLGDAITTTHDYAWDGQWVNEPVTIRLTATGGSGSLTTYYRINDGPAISGDLIQLSEDGEYSVSFWSVDSLGNSETPQSLTVKLDQTPPVLKPSLSPAPNAAGWHQGDVIVSFEAVDELSGVGTVTPPVTVTFEGAGQVVNGSATDLAGNSATLAVSVNLDKTAPVISNLQPTNGAQLNQKRPLITAGVFDELSGIDPASVRLALDGQTVNGSYDAATGIVSYTPASDLSSGSHGVTLTVTDLAGNEVTASSSFIIVAADPNLPPDPAEVAPALDPTIVSDMKTATSFLYTGENPIQTGMDPETIEPRRAAVIRGKVLDKDGQPLPGVKITVLNHGEYGQTLSRADGLFDLAVNGGGYLTVKYEKDGYLSAQRQVNVPWQDYVWAPEVILLQPDTKVTAISLTETSQAQVAQGSVVTDEDGTRQATVIFPAGTKVIGLNSETIHVRATEYTVGPNGPKAMPAVLPPAVGYTYCVDLTVDEAENVSFNQPVYFYVENFLNFPVGGIVPVGYYDYVKGAWIPSENGRIIRILNVNDGMAEVDVSGNGQAAEAETLADLGFTEGELRQLAATYQAGQSLWRAPITHFSPWDCNWPYGPPAGAQAPQQPKPQGDNQCDDPCEGNGSIIEIQNQVLRETLGIAGTPFTLNYSSGRVPGRIANNAFTVRLTGDNVNDLVKRIELEINVAGKMYTYSYDPNPNLRHTFIWNGLDAYDRPVKGGQTAMVRVGYVYDAVYQQPAELARSFGALSGMPISGSQARQEVTLWQEYQTEVRFIDSKEYSIGGWSLENHHYYDVSGQTLYLGNGLKRSAKDINGYIINTIAGGGSKSNITDGMLAIEASFPTIDSIAVGNDGVIYLVSSSKIYKISPDGKIFKIAGLASPGYNGDGIPAINAALYSPRHLSIASDGSIYFVDLYRIRRIDPNGIISTIAGTGKSGYSGDGGPAINAKIGSVYGMDIGPDGSVYIADSSSNRIRRISPDGIITTIAGTGKYEFSGDGGPALKAGISNIKDLAVGADGSIYFSEGTRIRLIRPNGIITTIAGGTEGYIGDGGQAIDAKFGQSLYISVSKDGSIYVADFNNQRIRKITPDGIVNKIAGRSTIYHSEPWYVDYFEPGFSGDGGPALMAEFSYPRKAIEGPDGCIYISDNGNHRIRRLSSVLSGFTAADIIIISEDGSELYRFNANGRHLTTVNALTGTTIYTFNYDSFGRLIEVIDADGNSTTIERDANGNPTAIVAPFGQRTTLAVNSEGYLATVTNPANEKIRLTYHDGGLLATLTDPKGNVHRYIYDELGRLIKDEDPAGGSTTLGRTETDNGYLITSTVKKDSTADYVTTYLTETLSTGRTRRVTQGCCGGPTEAIIGLDGSRKVTYPDGTVVSTVEGPDPRFGMQAPIIKSMTITTPGGLKYEMTGERTAKLEAPNDALSLLTQTDTVTINGKTYTTVYDATTRTYTSTTPMGRRSVTTLDEKGRVVKVEVPGLASVVFEYDERGRLVRTTEGSGSEARITSVTYAGNGLIDYVTNPLGRQTRFEYDPVGRVTRQILPGGKEISFAYDPNGNMIGLTPPGRPEHKFGYNAVNLNETYTPPDVGIGATRTEYGYNLAKQPTIVTRPDGKTIGFTYDTRGRLQELLIPEGEITYAYHATTGNLTSILASDSTMSYTYDGSLLKKAVWSGVIGGNVSVTYNNDLMVTSQSVNDGNTVSYGYDDDGLLTSAGALTISRDEQNGLITGSSIGSVSDSITYNSFGELERYQARFSGSTVYSVDFGTRDQLGRIVTKTETVNRETHTYRYVYDPNTDELTDVYKDGVLVSHYDYDDNGNRVKYTGADGTFSGTYDDQDRMLSYGGNTYQYTANGELAKKINAEGTTVYDYDVLGNLRAVTLPDGTRIEYVIDGQNRRIGKKVNGTLVQGFLYFSQLTPVAELDANGNIVARFVYATGVNVPDYMIKGGVTYRIITDHLGSPRVILNVATGEIAQRMDYDEFGNVMLDTNPGFQPFGFAGGLYDKDTGLVRFGARDYDAETGRWICKDPIGFDGGDTELYCYAGNDPINYIDSFGLAPIHIKIGSSATIAQWGPGWTYDFMTGKLESGDSIAFNTLAGGGWDLFITGSCPDTDYEVGIGIGKHFGIGLTFNSSGKWTGIGMHYGVSAPIVEFPVYVNVSPESVLPTVE